MRHREPQCRCHGDLTKTTCLEPALSPRVCAQRNNDSLRELRSADASFRQVDLCLGQRRLLHRQPWRQPARATSEISLLERIRRFEIRSRLH